MASKTIPAQTIKTCDACHVTLDKQNHRSEGALRIKQHALDMQGFACADASVNLDLCDRCLYTITSAINAAMAATPPAAQGEKGKA